MVIFLFPSLLLHVSCGILLLKKKCFFSSLYLFIKYLFISVCIYDYFFYLGDNPILSLFSWLLELFQLEPLGTLRGYLQYHIEIFYHFCFLAPRDAPGLSCIFPVPGLDSTMSSGKLGLFYWRTVLINHDVVLSVLIVTGVSLVLGSLKRQSFNIYMHINPSKNTHIHTYGCLCVC